METSPLSVFTIEEQWLSACEKQEDTILKSLMSQSSFSLPVLHQCLLHIHNPVMMVDSLNHQPMNEALLDYWIRQLLSIDKTLGMKVLPQSRYWRNLTVFSIPQHESATLFDPFIESDKLWDILTWISNVEHGLELNSPVPHCLGLHS
jgi:hypothetical protein